MVIFMKTFFGLFYFIIQKIIKKFEFNDFLKSKTKKIYSTDTLQIHYNPLSTQRKDQPTWQEDESICWSISC